MAASARNRRDTGCSDNRRARRGSQVHANLRLSSISGRAGRQRPRPGTGGDSSHAEQTYIYDRELEEFARWFADWWLRRGCELTDPDRHGG